MSRVSRIVVFVLLSVVAGCANPKATHENAPSGPLVNCYDEAREAVERRFANDCHSRVISNDEAARLGSSATNQPPTSRTYHIGGPRRRLISAGSGFFINKNGELLTSYHVVKDCTHVSVSPALGGSQIADVISVDALRDLALVKVPAVPRGTARFAPAPGPSTGHDVAVVGYPGHDSLRTGPSMFSAQILGSKNAAPGLRVLGFHGPVRQGNSGGPMIDQSGSVIGVVFAKTAPEPGKRDQNIGFAIPNDAVTMFLKRSGAVYTRADDPPGPLPNDLLQATKPILAQVGCWR